MPEDRKITAPTEDHTAEDKGNNPLGTTGTSGQTYSDEDAAFKKAEEPFRQESAGSGAQLDAMREMRARAREAEKTPTPTDQPSEAAGSGSVTPIVDTREAEIARILEIPKNKPEAITAATKAFALRHNLSLNLPDDCDTTWKEREEKEDADLATAIALSLSLPASTEEEYNSDDEFLSCESCSETEEDVPADELTAALPTAIHRSASQGARK
jgi:hypothetical protein